MLPMVSLELVVFSFTLKLINYITYVPIAQLKLFQLPKNCIPTVTDASHYVGLTICQKKELGYVHIVLWFILIFSDPDPISGAWMI